MSKGFKTFFITFLIGVTVFGFAASYLFKNVVGDFIDQLLNIAVTSDDGTSQPQDNSRPEESGDESISDESHGDTSYPEDFRGESMGTLVILKNQADEADTIILLRRSKTNAAASVAVIPADTRLFIDSVNTELRDLLKTRDIEFFCDKIEAITGVLVDYYVMLDARDVPEFADVFIDEFGPLTFDLPYALRKEKEQLPEESADVSVPETSVSDESLPDVSIPEVPEVPEYEYDIPAGRLTLTGETAAVILSHYENGDPANHDKLVSSLMSAVLVRLYTPSNADGLCDVIGDALALADTNMSKSDFEANIDIITSYTAFGTDSLIYPGTYRQVAGGGYYYTPDVDTAINNFKQYR